LKKRKNRGGEKRVEILSDSIAAKKTSETYPSTQREQKPEREGIGKRVFNEKLEKGAKNEKRSEP